jgi:hypothetical protein
MTALTLARAAAPRASRFPGTALIAEELGANGYAVFRQVLTAKECAGLGELYAQDNHFRSRVVMARHNFGQGEYRYFTYPLPDLIALSATITNDGIVNIPGAVFGSLTNNFTFEAWVRPSSFNDPTGDFEEQASTLSVEHSRTLGRYRLAHEISMANERHEASTEQLRQALVHYRTLAEELLNADTVDTTVNSEQPSQQRNLS